MLGYLSISITQAAILPCRILRPESKSRKFLFILTPHGIVRNIHRFFLKNPFSWNDQVIMVLKTIQILSPYSSPFKSFYIHQLYFRSLKKEFEAQNTPIYIYFFFLNSSLVLRMNWPMLRFGLCEILTKKTHTQFTEDVRKKFLAKNAEIWRTTPGYSTMNG